MLRFTSFTTCLLLACVAVLAAVQRGVEWAEVEAPETSLDAVVRLAPIFQAIGAASSGPLERVAYLSDSTGIEAPLSRSVPSRLQESASRITAGSPAVRVFHVVEPGLSAFDFYFLADEIARASPDQIALAFNPAWLSPRWAASASRPELSGWLGPKRLPGTLTMPIHWTGLTADRLLLYVAIVRAGGEKAWTELARDWARMGSARRKIAARADSVWWDRPGGDPTERYRAARFDYELRIRSATEFNARGQRARYGPAARGVDRDHPVLRALAGALEVFHAASIPTLVFVLPVNVERLARLGILDDPRGLETTLGAVEDVSRAAGATFLDLHDLLPEEGFRDAQGHFQWGDGIDGPQRVADALAASVAAQARAGAEGEDEDED